MKNMQKIHRFLMKKRIFPVFLVLSMLSMLFGCMPQASSAAAYSEESELFYNLMNKLPFTGFYNSAMPFYVSEELMQSFPGGTIDSHAPGSIIREGEGYLYAIYNTTEGGRIYLPLTKIDEGYYGHLAVIYQTTTLDLEDFDEIDAGATVEDLAQIEPAVNVLQFYALKERQRYIEAAQRGETAEDSKPLDRFEFYHIMKRDGLLHIQFQWNEEQQRYLVFGKKVYEDYRIDKDDEQFTLFAPTLPINATILPQDRI